MIVREGMSNIQHICIEVTRDPGRNTTTELWQCGEDGTPSKWAHRIDPTTWVDDLCHGMREMGIGWPRKPGVYYSAADGC
jgi:hypothetical protein